MALRRTTMESDAIDPGLRYLVACCRGDGDGDWFASRPSPEDFDSVVALALRHRVVPQLYRSWAGSPGRQDISPTAWERVEQLHHSCVARNMVLMEALRETLRLFAGEDIRTFPFKGPVLAQQLRGDSGARMLSDLDFLVHDADLDRAREALHSRGWRETRHMTPGAERAWRRAGRGSNLEHPDAGAVINLRSVVAPDYLPGRIDWGTLWEQRETIAFEGLTVHTIPPEALVALLCWHGAKHAWSRLVWIADVDALVRRGLVRDWTRVEREADRMGTGLLLRLGLLRAASVFGTPVPEEFLRAACRDVPPACIDYCRLRLTTRQPEAYRWWREQTFYLRLWEGAAARSGQILRIAFRPTITDYDVLNLPPGFEWLYRVLRPFRLAAKFAGKSLEPQER